MYPILQEKLEYFHKKTIKTAILAIAPLIAPRPLPVDLPK
jgi:hypothetical protein